MRTVVKPMWLIRGLLVALAALVCTANAVEMVDKAGSLINRSFPRRTLAELDQALDRLAPTVPPSKPVAGFIASSAVPTISPLSGTYSVGQPVTLADSDPRAVIHYTLDGTPPTASSPVYVGALTLTQAMSIKALAITGQVATAAASASYAVAQPSMFMSVLNIVTGASATGTVSIPYPALQSITITLTSDSPNLVAILSPTVTINKGQASATFTYWGKLPGIATFTASAPGYPFASRRLAGIPQAPSFASGTGSYSLGTSLLLTSTPGSLIRYTLDGSSPSGASAIYTSPIVLTSSMTIHAVAVGSGQISSVSSAQYTVVSNHLLFDDFPSSISLNSSLAPRVVIVDNSGTRVTGTALITLSFGSNPAGASLSGTTTVQAINGVALFPGIGVSATGSNYTLIATSPYLTQTVSNSFTVSPPQYYVANSGSDSSAGTINAPWKTLAQVNATNIAPGSTIYLQCGSVFREGLYISPSGVAGLPLTYTSYGDCNGTNLPLLSGADVLTTWTPESEGSFAAYYASEAILPSVVFEDNHRLPLVASKQQLVAGSSFYDTVNGLLYIRTKEDASPAMHALEASVRNYVIDGDGVNYVVLDGLEADKAADTAVLFSGNVNAIVINKTITNYSKASGIRFTANTGQSQTNVLIQGCTSNFNGLSGVMKGNGGDNFVVDGCVANYDAFDAAYVYSGALRFVSDGTTDANRITHSGVRNSTAGWAGINPDTKQPVASNVGSGVGIWCDTCGDGSFLDHNTVHDSVQAGIQLEFAGTVGSQSMSYNVSYNNFWGILHTRRSYNDVIANNTTWNNFVNCEFTGEYGGGDTTVGMVNNVYENNICGSKLLYSSGAVLVAEWGAENNQLGQGSGNIYRNNSFGVPSATNGTFAIFGAGHVVKSYAAIDAVYGSSTNSFTGDPLLTSPKTGDFTLKPTSLAIGAGYGQVDIGAY